MNKKAVLISWMIIIIMWVVMAYVCNVSKLVVPNPHEVVIAMFRMVTCTSESTWRNNCLWTNLLSTVYSVSVAFVLGSIIGIALGISVGSFSCVARALSSPLNFLRSIPVTALGSIFLVIFGFDGMRIAMATFGTLLVITMGVWDGIKNAPQEITDAAQLDGANKIQMIRYITWYLALPFTYANLRIALTLCLVLVVVGEMFTGGNLGIGRVIMEAQWGYAIPQAWAGIIFLGLIGVVLNKVLDILRPKIISWDQ